jgi:outer membrane protein OmpA-like peptidoglycan-associated protein
MNRAAVLLLSWVLSAPALAQAVRDGSALRLAEHASADQQDIDTLAQRIDALRSDDANARYVAALARAWLDFAFDARVRRDGEAYSAALQAARATADRQQGGDRSTAAPAPLFGQPKQRLDLWATGERLRAAPGWRCAAPLVAQLEGKLIETSHADAQLGWRHAKPYALAAQRLARDAQAAADSCAAPPLPAAPVAAAAEPLRGPTAPAALLVTPVALPSAQALQFALDSAALSRGTDTTLRETAHTLQREQALAVELHGHADERGSAAYNLKLSQARAEAVRTRLVQAGIAADRITLRAFGKSRPLAPGAHARNRRVELHFERGGQR